MLISTASDSTWVVLPGGCPPGTPGTTPTKTCSQSRGITFDSSLSTTWSSLGNYSLGVETNLGYDAPANYALDTVALGFSNATGGPTLQRQVVAGMETYLYYTGLFGLGNQPSNFTASNDASNLTGTVPYTSFLKTMKDQNLIPSLSWAYNAGAFYSKSIFKNDFRQIRTMLCVWPRVPNLPSMSRATWFSVRIHVHRRDIIPLLSSPSGDRF